MWMPSNTPPSPKVFKFARSDARQASAGDCFEGANLGVYCLPTVINIGVQKAGTGELQTWLGANPSVVAHGGEVHFFDSVRTRSCRNPWQGAKVRLQYAKALWRRRPLQASAVSGRVIFEKTPAYFDQASPRLISCTVPAVKLVVMLRRPAARAYSAYRMCQREMQLHWCRRPFDEALGSILSGDPPRENHKGLAKSAQLRRMLLMGQYSAHLRRWLRVFEPARLRLRARLRARVEARPRPNPHPHPHSNPSLTPNPNRSLTPTLTLTLTRRGCGCCGSRSSSRTPSSAWRCSRASSACRASTTGGGRRATLTATGWSVSRRVTPRQPVRLPPHASPPVPSRSRLRARRPTRRAHRARLVRRSLPRPRSLSRTSTHLGSASSPSPTAAHRPPPAATCRHLPPPHTRLSRHSGRRHAPTPMRIACPVRRLLALVRTHNISLLPAGASLKPGARPGPRELIAEELYGVRQGGGGTSGNGGDDDDDDDDDDSGDEGEAGGEGEE